MILLSFDVEATGLDKQQDHVIEVGAVLYSTGQQKCLESLGCLVKTDREITPEITKITGITRAAVDSFGYESEDALDNLLNLAESTEAWIGHNVLRYDKQMLESWLRRFDKTQLVEKLWIDTMTDLPGVEGKKLGYMAADHGFLNMFPHSALSDCQTVVKIVEHYDIDEVCKRARSPIVILQSHQKRNENDLVKAPGVRFRWNPDRKIWWKAVKEMDVEAFVKNLKFDVSTRPDLTIANLDIQG